MDTEAPGAGQSLADLAFLARALADENRLRILLHISTGKLSVTQIAEELGLSQPLVSHHLKELKRALLVDVERRGPFIHYGISRPEVLDVLHSIGILARRLIADRSSF
jgi:DNA-binding transcriptional ArsR family regulator